MAGAAAVATKEAIEKVRSNAALQNQTPPPAQEDSVQFSERSPIYHCKDSKHSPQNQKGCSIKEIISCFLCCCWGDCCDDD
ncbi:hypothetical protein D5018_05160 [Parashewanella curva]|uniref:Uncharacterized protein n=1 Tax=Parashewanella curva TaxID=2338552 RepID=A0A3L8Q1Y0_9GAMM|nr:hypothetical protein D5018_05160 [Parashewanella curva]